MTLAPPFRPAPQPALVAYLREILERAEAGEVQFFIGAAGVTPAGNAQGFDAKAFSAMGDRVPRYEPAHRMAAYRTVLEGLAGAANSAERAIRTLTPGVVV